MPSSLMLMPAHRFLVFVGARYNLEVLLAESRRFPLQVSE